MDFYVEFIFYYFNGGMQEFYWRGGNFLPWINIYAAGSIMIYFLTYKHRRKPLKVFLISLISCGILEYFSGWGMDIIRNGDRCWDYNNEILNFGNINGYICLRSVLFFGLSGLLLMYVVIPLCFTIARKMNKKLFLTISITLFSIIFIIAIIDIVLRVNTYKPEVMQEKITVRDNIKIPAQDKKFKSVLITGGLNRFAYGIGTMYLNVFLLKYLNIGYLYYSILNIVLNLSEGFSSKFWGNKSKDRKWKKIILPMCIIFIISFGLLLFFNNNYLIYLIPFVYILLGIGNSSYEMYDHIAIYESSKDGFQTSYVTFERFIEGIVTMILPLLTYLIFKKCNNGIKVTFLLAIIAYAILFVYNFSKNKRNDNIKQ